MTPCVLFRAFIDILCDDTVDVNTEYAAENFQTILQLSVESEKYDFVKELLRYPSCDPNIPNKVIEKCPLHTAVEKGNVPRPGYCWTVGQM